MTESDPAPSPAVARWRSQLSGWAIPDLIVTRAAESPWGHTTAAFAVDDTIDRDLLSTRWAREVLPPVGGTVLDVGCGGGRSSIGLVPPAATLVGVDTSGAMLDRFVEAAAAAGAARRTVHGAWPEVAVHTPSADVVVCHHVLYDVDDIVPFVVALTARARLAVVVEIPVRHPMSAWSAAWRHFWDVERPDGPTHLDLLAVLRELGLDPEVAVGPHRTPSRASADPSALVPTARRRLCLPPERDGELTAWLASHPPEWVTDVAVFRWPGAAEAADPVVDLGGQPRP